MWRHVTMTYMATEEATERVGAGLRPVATVCAGAAVVLLVWAAVLGCWSRLAAPRAIGDGAWYLDRLHRWGESLPDNMTITVSVVAVLLLIAIAYSVLRGPEGWDRPGTPALFIAVMALLFFAYFSQGIPAFYRMVMENFPVTAAVPTGVAAWVLSVVGTVATVLGSSAFPRLRRDGLRLAGVGAVIAVVVASVVTVVALRAGDDDRYVDASTAAAAEVAAAPSVPPQPGQRSFTVTVPDGFTGDNPARPQFSVAAAGAGFVVYRDHRVTAYGADGQERWHYLRTGPGEVSVNGARVFDNGATVVVLINDALVGLDAVTGEQLWSSADYRMAYAISQESGYNVYPPYLMYRDEASWTRYDTRTGTPMWTVPAPHPRCDVPRSADTASWLVSVTRCQAEGGSDIRVTALNPDNGETHWDTVVLHGKPELDAVAAAANSVGVLLQFAGEGSPRGLTYVNVADKSVTALPERGSAQPSMGPGDDFVFSDWNRERHLALYAPDGKQRCTVAEAVRGIDTEVPGQGGGLAYLAFADSFVVTGAGSLRSFDSVTCRQAGQVPAESVVGLVPVPGAVLVLRRDGQTLQIDGYTG